MIKNREELIEVAQMNAKRFEDDVKRKIVNFMCKEVLTLEEFAYSIGCDERELRSIMEGNSPITIDFLSKILVATDHAVGIMPVSEIPNQFSRSRQPTLRCDELEELQPEDEKPLFEDLPRDARGRFTKRTDELLEKYLNVSDDELIDVIDRNIWDSEIDTENATHEELAKFVADKERILRSRNEEPVSTYADTAPQKDAPENVHTNSDGLEKLKTFISAIEKLSDEANENPVLADAISRLIGK